MTMRNDASKIDTSMFSKFHCTDAFYYFYLFVLCALFYVRDVHEVNVPLWVYLGFGFIGYSFFDYSQAVAFTAAMPLFNHGLQTNYIVIMAIVFYLIKYGAHMRINKIHGIVIFLMIFELLHSALEPFSLPEYFRYCVQYLYIALVIGESRIKDLLQRPTVVINTFIFIAAYFMLDVILVTLKYVSVEEMMREDFRFGFLGTYLSTKVGLYDNENMVALFAIVAIALLLVSAETSEKFRLLKVAFIVYFVYFGLMTGSKTFLLSIGIVILVYILYVLRRSIVKMLGVVTGIGLLLAIGANTVFKPLFDRVVERFLADDITTGRASLFQQYNEYIFSDRRHFLFGIGLQGVEEKTGIDKAPHNGFQEVLLCWGIIGLVAIVVLLVCMVLHAKKYPNTKKFVNYIPLFIFLIFIQTIQFVRLSSIFGLLVVLYAAMLCGRGNDEEKVLYSNG